MNRRSPSLAAAGLYAIGVVLQKQALRDVDPLTVTSSDTETPGDPRGPPETPGDPRGSARIPGVLPPIR